MRKFVITVVTVAAAIITVAMPTARADPNQLDPEEVSYMDQYGAEICGVIEMNPTPKNVIDVGVRIMGDGFDAESTVDILNYSVAIYCEQWGPLLDETGRVYGEKGPMKRAL